MIDSIVIAESGLQGYEQGLQTISNNTANMNTPGFKGSTMQFADLANLGDTATGDSSLSHAGYGLRALGTSLDFAPGPLQSTSNPLDLAVGGQGFFTLRDAKGEVRYTKDGQFKFDATNQLISTTTGDSVMALDSSGALVPVSIANAQTNPPKATSKLVFAGIVSTSSPTNTVSDMSVIDPTGALHALTATLTQVTGKTGEWQVALSDGTTAVGSPQTLTFSESGNTVTSGGLLTYSYRPAANGPAMPITLDFTTGVTSFSAAGTSGGPGTLRLSDKDGYGAGSLTGETFDATGTLLLTYSNGQTTKPMQLALAQFDSPDQVEALGNNLFRAKDGVVWNLGVAGSGSFGSIQSSEIEGSNVDLSREFSNLVIMQRGYQACSQVVSTTGDMLTALFGMMSK
jgi:flagellar hook protein FlgE